MKYNAYALNKNHSYGFLYCPKTQQYLLQQRDDEDVGLWTLIENLHQFHPKNILPVYDYISKGKKQVISYSEVKEAKDYPGKKNLIFKWFTVKELSKLPLEPRAKQDLIVGRRVIDSQTRKDTGELTIG